MKPLSFLLLTLGCFGLLFSISMNTTVPTDIGSRIHNIGLISDRQTYLFSSATLLVLAVILFGFSTLRSPITQRSSRLNLVWIAISILIGSVCAWSLFSRSQPVESVPQALSAEHPLESDPYFKLAPFIVRLKGPESYFQASLVFALASASESEIIEQSIVKIRHDITLLLSGKTREQVTGSKNLAKLAEEIQETANRALKGKSKVDDVLFISVVTQ